MKKFAIAFLTLAVIIGGAVFYVSANLDGNGVFLDGSIPDGIRTIARRAECPLCRNFSLWTV